MPEIGAVHIGLFILMLVIGVVLGWIFRSDRCSKEKIAVNASWQEQIDAQQSEHDRLSAQNVGLMEQIGQYQASNKDSKMRSKELSDALKEAFERRDELQRSLKEVRTQFDVATAQRDKLLTDIENSNVRGEATAGALKEKDDKIFRLSRELTTWQSRVPPLVERFRERDQDAKQLQADLDEASERIAELESADQSDGTGIAPLNAESLPDGMDASNEQYDATISGMSVPEDQIEPGLPAVQIEDEDTDDEPDDEEDVAEAAADFTDVEELQNFDDDPAEEAVETIAPFDDEEEPALNESFDANGTTAAGAIPATMNSSEVAERDDLKMIKGVGPAIEKTLNDLGIYRFNQIAEMSEYDIDRVAQQLRGFRSRIYREDWIGQARTLQYQKNNDFV